MRKRRTGSKRNERRLRTLRRQIDAAQSMLAALRTAIEDARGERGLVVMNGIRDENDRLRQQNVRAAVDAEIARVALKDAIKASETDALTELVNRSVVWDRLTHDIAISKRRGIGLVVIYLDLNDFKRINDEFGHDVGDLVLQHTARQLASTVRAGDTVCRMGGDEFVLIFCDAGAADVPMIEGKIRGALETPCLLGNRTIGIKASLGASVYPDDAVTARTLVKAADSAMYLAKGEPRP